VDAPVDPRIVEDLRYTESVRGVFGGAGERLEFWEMYTLVRTDRDQVVAEVARLEDGAAPGEKFMERLGHLRRERSALVGHLRLFLALLPKPLDAVVADLVILFILDAPADREAAERWVTNPVGHVEQAAPRIGELAQTVDRYRRALFEAHVSAPPRDFPEPPPPEPPKIHPQTLKDLQVVERCRALLEEAGVRFRTWEIFLALAADRASTYADVGELDRLKAKGGKGEFAGVAYRMRQKLAAMRAEHGALAVDLEVYLQKLGLPGWKGSEDLVLAFILSSEAGRLRARRWIEEGRRTHQAARIADDLIARARLYREALDGIPPVGLT
jgi:hypothetical protein